MQKTVTLLMAMLCIVSTQAIAQSFNISGTVKSKTGLPVSGATVTLLKATDSAWVKSELTEDSGWFTLHEVGNGDYIVAVIALGYINQQERVLLTDKDINLNILIDKKGAKLDEVVITGNKPFLEREPGKTIVNISEEKAAGNNVLDLLRKLPGISINSNGDITMNGKQGLLVLLNGKQTYLSGQDLSNYLRTMSAEQLAKVELISQPSAKYDAEGNTGIIDLKTKKNGKEGLSGSASARYTQTAFSGTNDNLRVNYKKNKTNLMVNAGYYSNAGFLKQTMNRNFRDPGTYEITGKFAQDTYMEERFRDYSLSVNAEQELNEKTTASLVLSGVYHPNEETDKSVASIQNLVTNTITYNEFINHRTFTRQNVNAVAQVDRKLAKDHELTVNADYLFYDILNTQDIVNNNFDAQKQPIPGGISLKGTLPTDITVYSAKADYTGKIGKDTRIEAGIKTSYLNTGNGVFFDINHNGIWIKDTVRSNNFKYDENINSAYASCNLKLAKDFETKLGLRAEQTNAYGVQTVGNQRFERHYLSFFPTAFVSYKMNEDYSFELNYGRRVQRPEYKQMNPFIEFNSQYKYSTGNPNLLPQYSQNIELTANYQHNLSGNVKYRHVSDIINSVATQDNVNYIYRVMPVNIGSNTALEFSLTFNKELYKWWEVSATAYAFNLHYDGIYIGQPFEVSGGGYGVFTSGDFNFGNNWKATYWLNAAGKQRESSMAIADSNLMYGMSLSKKLFHDTTLVKLNIVDPFRTYVYGASVQMRDIDSRFTNRYNTMDYSLSVTYDFGKQLDRMRHNNSDADGTGRMRM